MIGGDGINDESNKTAPAPTRNTDLTKYTLFSVVDARLRRVSGITGSGLTLTVLPLRRPCR